MTTTKNALIVVDAQNSFCEGGELASTGAAQTCRRIASYLSYNARNYSTIILSKDWHITPGEHFKTWPQHCVAGTSGADFFWPIQEWYDGLDSTGWYEDGSFKFGKNVHTVYKGQHNDGYSAWFGVTKDGFYTKSRISDLFNAGTVDLNIDICGLVTEHCVKATALHAVQEKTPSGGTKRVKLLEDLTTANDYRLAVDALAEMEKAGVVITNSDLD